MAKLLPDRRNAALSLGRYGPLGGGMRSGGIGRIAWLMSSSGDVTTDNPQDGSTRVSIISQTDMSLTITINDMYVVADAAEYVTLEAG